MDGMINARIEWGSEREFLKLFNLEKGGRVQTAIDNATIKWCSLYTPRKTGRLMNSAFTASQIGQGNIVYDTPYARKLYYNPQFRFNTALNPLAGAYWFERAKADHAHDILMEAIGATNK